MLLPFFTPCTLQQTHIHYLLQISYKMEIEKWNSNQSLMNADRLNRNRRKVASYCGLKPSYKNYEILKILIKHLNVFGSSFRLAVSRQII